MKERERELREAREEMLKKKYEGKRVVGIEGCEGLFVGGRLVAMNEVCCWWW